MPHQWFKKPRGLIYLPLILVLLTALACGTAATPTEAPEPTATSAAAATSAPAPTAMAQPTTAPGDGMMAGIEHAPSFAEFWQPPTSVYGELVKGGHLRIIYEDPLDHGNAWGAATGTTDRYRSPTMNLIVQENPYDSNAPAIPDLAQGWTIHDDNQGVTFRFHEGIQWHNGEAFTCEDARFSVETMVTGEGLTASYMGGRLQHLDLNGLECTDDQTLEMRFDGPT
ncbi:MAG TPA: ABC transporter substrate-binding protein, partial [Dehalococcoidia bacterium]|nr:ABC transporter substrate-binding protein [Dehalococcoidia bacterium]